MNLCLLKIAYSKFRHTPSYRSISKEWGTSEGIKRSSPAHSWASSIFCKTEIKHRLNNLITYQLENVSPCLGFKLMSIQLERSRILYLKYLKTYFFSLPIINKPFRCFSKPLGEQVLAVSETTSYLNDLLLPVICLLEFVLFIPQNIYKLLTVECEQTYTNSRK